jgi:hypothetical protein
VLTHNLAGQHSNAFILAPNMEIIPGWKEARLKFLREQGIAVEIP